MASRISRLAAVGALTGATVVGGGVALANDDHPTAQRTEETTKVDSSTTTQVDSAMAERVAVLEKNLSAALTQIDELETRLEADEERTAAVAAALASQLPALAEKVEAALAQLNAPPPAPPAPAPPPAPAASTPAPPPLAPEPAPPAPVVKQHDGDWDGAKDGHRDRGDDWDEHDSDRHGDWDERRGEGHDRHHAEGRSKGHRGHHGHHGDKRGR